MVAVPSSPPAPSDEELVAQATYDYWQQIGNLLAAARSEWPNSAAAISDIEALADQIESLPTFTVDLDAVGCGLHVAAFSMADLAALIFATVALLWLLMRGSSIACANP